MAWSINYGDRLQLHLREVDSCRICRHNMCRGKEGPVEKSHVGRHLLGDRQELKKTKVRRREYTSKNAVRMREKRKDPEYRRKDNERRLEQRREKNLQEKEETMKQIPNLSILCETASNVENFTVQKTPRYIVNKQLKLVELTTYIHERVGEEEEENRDNVVVFRN